MLKVLPHVKNLFHFLLLGSTLFCAAAGASSPPRPSLHYQFDLRDPAQIHVAVGLPAPQPDAEVLLLPSVWAGQAELYRAVSNLHVTNPDATLLPTGNPARWLLHSSRPGRVTVTYDLAQDWSGPLQHPFEHRVILGPDLFEFNGDNGLVAPVLSGSQEVEVTFDFVGLPPAHKLVTSFGTAPHQHFIGPWSDVRNALFTGGQMQTENLMLESGNVLLAMHGNWSFPPGKIAPEVRDIIETERSLWHGPPVPFYAIVISPYGNTASGGGGSGFTNIFNLFLSDRKHFGTDTVSLLAHEAFHHWNPGALGTVANTEEIAWFGEGFTRFYQDTILEHAGIIDEAEYLSRLNATIRDYLTSPRLNLPNAELARSTPSLETAGNFTGGSANPVADRDPTSIANPRGMSLAGPISPQVADSATNQEPYLRGAMIALWLNHQIDQQSNGRYTLTDLMLALHDERSEPLTPDRIFSTAGRFVDPATTAQFRSFALEGLTVPISPGTLGRCVAFVDRPTWTFDLGFDPVSLRHDGVVNGLRPGSRAWEAGVRNGQILGGFSLWNGNAEREVSLTIREPNGRRERLTYLPQGRRFSVPQAEPIANCPEAPLIPR